MVSSKKEMSADDVKSEDASGTRVRVAEGLSTEAESMIQYSQIRCGSQNNICASTKCCAVSVHRYTYMENTQVASVIPSVGMP